MRCRILWMMLAACGLWLSRAEATFSIVAVDTVTGEVGGAGASCIPGSRIINDLIMGVGAIHTQALYITGNQNYAHELMEMGLSPEQIIDSLEANDFAGDATVRQYGVVDLMEGGRSAGFTGENCTDWAGHLTGPTYAIQGNILLGPEIIDSMEYAFTHAEGMLSDKLLAAVLAARVPGADTRCLERGTSAISAFIRVVRTGDNLNERYCDLNVNDTPSGEEPLDLLEQDYADWVLQMSTSADEFRSTVEVLRDSLTVGGGDTTLIVITARNNQGEPLGDGVEFILWTSLLSQTTTPEYIGEGVYTSTLSSALTTGADTITVFPLTGLRQRELRDHPVVRVVEATAAEERALLPDDFAMSIHPNPFNPAARISFSLPAAGRVALDVFDITGRKVMAVADRHYTAGTHAVEFHGAELPSGIYFVAMRGAEVRIVKKAALVR